MATATDDRMIVDLSHEEKILFTLNDAMASIEDAQRDTSAIVFRYMEDIERYGAEAREVGTGPPER